LRALKTVKNILRGLLEYFQTLSNRLESLEKSEKHAERAA